LFRQDFAGAGAEFGGGGQELGSGPAGHAGEEVLVRARLAVFLFVMVTLAGLSWADDVQLEKPGLPAWGTLDWVEYNLSGFEFYPAETGTSYQTNSGNRNLTAGSALYAVAHLPSGVKLVHMDLRGCDSEASMDMSLFLWRCPAVASLGCEAVANTGSSAAPGCSAWSTATFNDTTISNYDYSYVLGWYASATSGLSIRHAELYYQLQVSPAPASATFADVPVGAFGFQHVEALAASGITGGCGGGNFCPNEPLTRVQMAVFLAKALGLHWPY
jgi:hypothetical protein